MQKTYAEGKCLFDIYEKCILGDKGVPYDPLCCIACIIAKAVKVILIDQ